MENLVSQPGFKWVNLYRYASVARKAGAKTIKKTYVMLVSTSSRGGSEKPPVPLRSVVHWMYPGPFGRHALGGRGLKRSQARLLRYFPPGGGADGGGVETSRVMNGETRTGTGPTATATAETTTDGRGLSLACNRPLI
jgi:hypothetical protein